MGSGAGRPVHAVELFHSLPQHMILVELEVTDEVSPGG